MLQLDIVKRSLFQKKNQRPGKNKRQKAKSKRWPLLWWQSTDYITEELMAFGCGFQRFAFLQMVCCACWLRWSSAGHRLRYECNFGDLLYKYRTYLTKAVLHSHVQTVYMYRCVGLKSSKTVAKYKSRYASTVRLGAARLECGLVEDSPWVNCIRNFIILSLFRLTAAGKLSDEVWFQAFTHKPINVFRVPKKSYLLPCFGIIA